MISFKKNCITLIDADGWSLVLILRVCKTGFRVHKGGDGDGVA